MSALSSSVVSAATTVGGRLFQWGIVLGKKIPQGITISLEPAILWVVWWPGRSCTLRPGQVLVFINRHNPTMNLVEEKQRGLIPPGLQSWPLQLIEHLANTTSVAPPPAGLAGCRPLYLLHLLNLSFTIRAPNECCILPFRVYKSFVCNLLSTPRCKSPFLRYGKCSKIFSTAFLFVKKLLVIIIKLSRNMRFLTMWYVRPAKPQLSLRIRAVWSEPLLVAWIFYDF